MTTNNSGKMLKFTAYAITILFMVMILLPLLFLISNSVKDNKKIYDFPPGFLPEEPKSINIVLDYSGEEFKDTGILKDMLLRDSVLAMYSTTYEMDKDSIFELKVFGTRNGKNIFYARAHKMQIQMQIDYGLYFNSVPTKDIILANGKYKQAADELGYLYDTDGISKEFNKAELGKNSFNTVVGKYLKDKYDVKGELRGTILDSNVLLAFENYKYYFQVPSLLYKNNPTIKTFGFFIFILNTVLVTGSGIIIQILVCSVAAYPLSRLFDKRLSNILLMFFLGCMMVPFISVMIPQFMLFKDLGMYNNYAALIAPWLIPHGLNVFLFKSFFDRLPQSLFDAMRIDGASEWYVFSRICLPLSKPIISIIALSTFLSGWSDFFWPWMVSERQNLWTLSVALYNLSRMDQVKLNFLMGMSMVTIIPVIILTFALSDQIKQSLATSGIKG